MKLRRKLTQAKLAQVQRDRHFNDVDGAYAELHILNGAMESLARQALEIRRAIYDMQIIETRKAKAS